MCHLVLYQSGLGTCIRPSKYEKKQFSVVRLHVKVNFLQLAIQMISTIPLTIRQQYR